MSRQGSFTAIRGENPMATDYIPGADGAFDAWQINFITYASANAAALGLDPLVDIPPLTAAQGIWTSDYPANTAAQAAAHGSRTARSNALQPRSCLPSGIRYDVGLHWPDSAIIWVRMFGPFVSGRCL